MTPAEGGGARCDGFAGPKRGVGGVGAAAFELGGGTAPRGEPQVRRAAATSVASRVESLGLPARARRRGAAAVLPRDEALAVLPAWSDGALAPAAPGPARVWGSSSVRRADGPLEAWS